ncbi:hypothetical protein [Pasteuria penetrans]|uniref:hypothetical protein n=1 Tax=Pasteuria penetrans TaxID=86005 RepID=UPI0011ECDF08|nr:hypothetical protein [Pasteuria penetrans]
MGEWPKTAMGIDHECRFLAPSYQWGCSGRVRITIHLRHDGNDRVAHRTTNIMERGKGGIKPNGNRFAAFQPWVGSSSSTDGVLCPKTQQKATG